jgi:hypothetical protein
MYNDIDDRPLFTKAAKEIVLGSGVAKSEDEPSRLTESDWLESYNKRSLSGVPESHDERSAVWHKIVENFTRRSLTVPVDRLRGISGIASRFGLVLGEEYWAGLWQSELPRELLWCLDRARPDPAPTQTITVP